mgnify:CR=1 FL=1
MIDRANFTLNCALGLIEVFYVGFLSTLRFKIEDANVADILNYNVLIKDTTSVSK